MLDINMQLFAEGGEAGAEGGSNAAAFDVDAEIQKRFPYESGLAAPHRKAKAQEAQDEPDAGKHEQDGAQHDAGAQQEAQSKDMTPEEADAELERLIKGPLKDAYAKRFQGGLNERFKTQNAKMQELQQKYDRMQKAYSAYTKKLGVDAEDYDAIEQATMEDATNFRARAIENNRTVEEEREVFRQEQASAEEKAAQEAAQRAAEAQQAETQRQQIWAQWDEDASKIKETDKNFDLRKEIEQNEEFRGMLDAGVSVKLAYQATHFDERMAAVAGAVERQTALNTANKIAAGRNRPAEGGLGNVPANSSKTSYENMSNKEFLKLFHSMGY